MELRKQTEGHPEFANFDGLEPPPAADGQPASTISGDGNPPVPAASTPKLKLTFNSSSNKDGGGGAGAGGVDGE